MSCEDLNTALTWAASEGWNPGLEDATTFFRIDPSGFLMGWLDGRPIASISAVDWGSGFGFIGLYIVVPEHRGQGFGMQLWQAAMQHLEGKTIGLDGVVAQQANYARSGFQLAHRNLRYEGTAGQLAGPAYGHKVDASEVDSLLALDVAPAQRSAYLTAWLTQPGAIALRSDGGFLLCRPCLCGVKVGPLVAENAEQARQLLGGLCVQLDPQTPVFWDIPESNPAALELAERYGMALQFETARMYHGQPTLVDAARWFGVTTLELG